MWTRVQTRACTRPVCGRVCKDRPCRRPACGRVCTIHTLLLCTRLIPIALPFSKHQWKTPEHHREQLTRPRRQGRGHSPPPSVLHAISFRMLPRPASHPGTCSDRPAASGSCPQPPRLQPPPPGVRGPGLFCTHFSKTHLETSGASQFRAAKQLKTGQRREQRAGTAGGGERGGRGPAQLICSPDPRSCLLGRSPVLFRLHILPRPG